MWPRPCARAFATAVALFLVCYDDSVLQECRFLLEWYLIDFTFAEAAVAAHARSSSAKSLNSARRANDHGNRVLAVEVVVAVVAVLTHSY